MQNTSEEKMWQMVKEIQIAFWDYMPDTYMFDIYGISFSLKLITGVRASKVNAACGSGVSATSDATDNVTLTLASDYMLLALTGLDALFKQVIMLLLWLLLLLLLLL